MKKTIIAILFVVAQVASATSLRNVRLEMKVSPLRGIVGNLKTTYIHVFGGGEVSGTQCEAIYRPGPGITGPRCSKVELDQLGNHEMRKIERLIKKAAKGKMVSPDPHAIRCMAMPFEQREYTANNGNVMLLAGAFPCGDSTYNDTVAARKLVQKLDEYRNKFALEIEE